MSKPVVGVEPRNLAETESVLETSGSRREVEPAGDFSDETAVTGSFTGRIIEFPRSWTPPPVPLDQLAEPVMSRPRFLEAPEFVPPPPALGGITIEPPQQPEIEKRPGIDIPLQGAPLGRRLLSALIDDVIIVAACALFGFVFWKLTAIQPPRLQMICLAGGLAALLWAAYQYLLMVYAGITPGLHWARLELTEAPPAGDFAAGAYLLRTCRPFLWAWVISGFSWTKTPYAGTTVSRIPTLRPRSLRRPPTSNG
jgi:hypothetical protein